MVRIARVVALCAALAAPAAAWSQATDSMRTPASGVGSSEGVASGWQYQRRGRRTVQASGVAVAGLLLLAAATASSRR